MNVFNWIFHRGEEQGSPCYVVSNESNVTAMIEGTILENKDQQVRIRYKWLDKTWHSFITGQQNYAFTFESYPVFYHDVGCPYGSYKSGNDEELKMSSEYLDQILGINIGGKMISTLEEYMEEGGLPWKMILIGVAIVIGVVVLWQTGILQSLMESLQESI